MCFFCFSNNKIKFNISINKKKIVFILLRVTIAKLRFLIRSIRLKFICFTIILLLLIYNQIFLNNKSLCKYLIFAILTTIFYTFFQLFKVLIKITLMVANLFNICFITIIQKNFL